MVLEVLSRDRAGLPGRSWWTFLEVLKDRSGAPGQVVTKVISEHLDCRTEPSRMVVRRKFKILFYKTREINCSPLIWVVFLSLSPSLYLFLPYSLLPFAFLISL